MNHTPFTAIGTLLMMLRARWRHSWQDRWQELRDQPEAGYSTETVLVTALLVVAAIAVIAILVVKITAKANGITM